VEKPQKMILTSLLLSLPQTCLEHQMPARTEKQAKFMRAVAHGWKPKKGKGPSPSVARHFMHVKEQAAKRYGGQTDRLRSFGAQPGTTIGKDVSRRSGFTGTQSRDVARRRGFEGTQNQDVARGEGRFGAMNPDRDRAFKQRTRLRPSTPDLRRRRGELRMNNKKHEGSPLKEKKMNNFIHNPYQIHSETMVNEDYCRRVFENTTPEEDESSEEQAKLKAARAALKVLRKNAKEATLRMNTAAKKKKQGLGIEDHQEHEGDGINELTPASNPNSWAARAIASRQQKVKGMHRRGEEVEDAANRVIQTTGGKTGAEKVGAPSEPDRSWATAGSDEQIRNVRAGSPKRITPRALGSPGKEVRNVRTQTGRAIKRVRAQGPQYGQAMGAEGPGTGRQWGGQLPTNPEQRGEIAKRAIRPWGRFKNWRRVKRAQKAFKN